jgi:hypothetical protein
MGKVQAIRSTVYRDTDEGFEYTFEPVEDSITITETPEGFEARYLVQDDDAEPPEDGDALFLVNYHRDFEVHCDKIITKDDLVNWYRNNFDEYKEDPCDEKEVGKFPLAETYHIFPLSCLVHSGVWLSLHSSFSCDPGGWDTSHVGAILARKREWPEADKAYEAAEGLVETWNQYLTGDVYGIAKETYDKEKNQLEEESVWGFYGEKYALDALKTDI